MPSYQVAVYDKNGNDNTEVNEIKLKVDKKNETAFHGVPFS